MEQGLIRAGIAPSEIDYICAHATSTPVGDAVEAGGILAVFGEPTPFISSTKSMTGHELWMSGASQVVYSVIMAREGFIAPNINFEKPDQSSERLNIVRRNHPSATPKGLVQFRRIRRDQLLSDPGIRSMKYDCLIVGGGLSGMTAAIIMAQKGYHTALVEKSRRTAPTVRGFKREGLFFDTGFHYTGGLNEGEPLNLFFRYLGLSEKITPYPFDPEGFDIFRCLEPEFELAFPFGYERIRERFSERFPRRSKGH